MQKEIYYIDDNIDISDVIEKVQGNDKDTILKNIKTEEINQVLKDTTSIVIIPYNISPLTGLPGNTQIHNELKRRLKNTDAFSVLYLDLDNFKAYNDVYGFLKGDNIIKYTADVIKNVIKEENLEDAFIGHIGGDDFVVVVKGDDVENLCQTIIATFDSRVNEFFKGEDIEKGYIEVENRKGIMEQFPLTSISIGVVICEPGKFQNILEIGEVGAQMKHIAKTGMGSSYAIDRRK